MYRLANHEINKFLLLLQKVVVYSYEYIDDEKNLIKRFTRKRRF